MAHKLNEQMKDIIQRKLFMMRCFYSSCCLAPIEPSAAHKHSATNIYLSALIMELSIKCIYELDHNKKAPTNHRLLETYEQCSEESQKQISSLYEDARARSVELYKAITSDVIFPPLEEILLENIKIVQDFKYNAQHNKKNNAADGQFFTHIFEILETRLNT